MNEQSFVDRKERDWRRLGQLSDRAAGSAIEKLTDDELKELVDLYRRASTDLAVARTKSRNSLLTDHLNDLLLRAYGVLYRAPRKPFWSSLLAMAEMAAATVRARRWYIFVSAAIFFGSWIFVYLATSAITEAKDAVVGPNSQELFEGWKTGKFEERTGSESIMMGGFYASNNPRVAIMEAAFGAATFGVGSVFLLFQNGALIGALSSEMSSVGKLDFLLTSIAPHGVPELSGAIISGAAGLLFGWALINPGRQKRSDALKAVSKDGITLILTSVLLMFIAAPIEAFFSFNPNVPQEIKLVVAILSFLIWMLFWCFFGKKSAPAEEAV